MLKLKVAFPSTTIKLDIAFINVSTVEIVKAKPSIITNKDSKPVKIPEEIYSKFKPYFCDTIKT